MSNPYRGRRGLNRAAVAAAAAAVLVALALTAGAYLAREGRREARPDSSAGPQTVGGPSQSAPPEEDSSPEKPAGEPQSPQAVKTAPAQPAYDFSQPAPESEPVDNSYFDDAAFVGDSRTDGFMIYSGIRTGKNLTSNGLSIFKLEEKKALRIDGEDYTLLEALALEEYGKVYLSLGVNELGVYNDQGFYDSYCAAIDQIRAVQPSAVIYIQGLIPLNEGQIAATSGRTYLTNEHLRVYNDLMRQAAREKQVVFLDLYPEFVDDDGQLPAQASKDGVHLRQEYCVQWLDYLKTHTVDFDTLYPDGPPAPEDPGPERPDPSTADGSV